MNGRNATNYRNPCLTMHQPWASLLVYGIKRIEGRSWPAPLRGRIWIHAAGKVPDNATIKAMEDFYRQIYAVDGITDLKFPESYPVSRLIGCVEVVGCVRGDELTSWKMVPEGVRLEAQTNFCWLCEKPQKLLIPFEMRGYQGVYNLEKKIFDAAVRGLTTVKGPMPVQFPLPNPRDSLSLKPGSIALKFPESRATEVDKSSSLNAAIAGARAAATQFTRKDQYLHTNVDNNTRNHLHTNVDNNTRNHLHTNVDNNTRNLASHSKFKRGGLEKDKFDECSKATSSHSKEHTRFAKSEDSHSQRQPDYVNTRLHSGAPSKLFGTAIRGLQTQ